MASRGELADLIDQAYEIEVVELSVSEITLKLRLSPHSDETRLITISAAEDILEIDEVVRSYG